jgi:hypothetical protein
VFLVAFISSMPWDNFPALYEVDGPVTIWSTEAEQTQSDDRYHCFVRVACLSPRRIYSLFIVVPDTASAN